MSENDATVPPRIDGDASEPVPACERTGQSSQGRSGRFRIHKVGDPWLPWCMDYPEPDKSGAIGVACSRYETAVEEFTKAIRRRPLIIIRSHKFVPGARGDDSGCWYQDVPDVDGPGIRCGVYRQYHVDGAA